MAGIVFIRTVDLPRVREFYIDTVGMKSWLEQPGIAILSHENLLVGFQAAEHSDRDSLITFWLRSRDDVDAMYERLLGSTQTEPAVNDRYRIYNFLATDPDDRRVEFQAFLHGTNAVTGVPPLPPA